MEVYRFVRLNWTDLEGCLCLLLIVVGLIGWAA